MKQRTCRICGCTDNDCRQCIERTGMPCHWIEPDLCSACRDAGNQAIINYVTNQNQIHMKTEFFTQLAQVLDGCPCTFAITPKDGKLTVSFVPRDINDTKSNLKPLNMVGEPSEFDEGFLKAIHEAIDIAAQTGLVKNWGEYRNGAEAAGGKKVKTATPTPATTTGTRKTITIDEITQEQVDQVKKMKEQKKSFKQIAEKVGITEEQAKAIHEGKLKAGKTVQKNTQMEINQLLVEEPKKVSHTPEALQRFKTIITNQQHDAEDVELLAGRQKERTSDEEQKIRLTGEINNAKSTIANCKLQLEAIEAGTFGTKDDQTVLIPEAELIESLTKKTA